MHKTCFTVRIAQLLQTTAYFFLIISRKSFHYDTHWPNIVQPYMWTAYSFSSFSFKKIRIIIAPYQFTSILVNCILERTISQIRSRQQTGNISIIHTKHIAKPIHFKSINPPTNRMVKRTIPANCGIYFIS